MNYQTSDEWPNEKYNQSQEVDWNCGQMLNMWLQGEYEQMDWKNNSMSNGLIWFTRSMTCWKAIMKSYRKIDDSSHLILCAGWLKTMINKNENEFGLIMATTTSVIRTGWKYNQTLNEWLKVQAYQVTCVDKRFIDRCVSNWLNKAVETFQSLLTHSKISESFNHPILPDTLPASVCLIRRIIERFEIT